MIARPILFSAPMVRALIAGTKTQTRRLLKPTLQTIPYGIPGDLLWVRETFAHVANFPPTARYYATDDVHEARKKRPAIHMPRWASRLTLEITDVRVQRLQDISEEEAIAEGVCSFQEANDRPGSWEGLSQKNRNGLVRAYYGSARKAYSALWESINGQDSWDTNPWIVALTFKVHKDNIDAVLERMKEAGQNEGIRKYANDTF